MPNRPQLLVSVRNSEEALVAARGGVPIIDIKEPRSGSLGMSSVATIESVVTVVRENAPAALLSAACGEAREWSARPSLEMPEGLSYVKMGLAGLRGEPDWVDRWMGARAKVGSEQTLQWIAVAYVDDEPAQAPPVEEVVQAAAEFRCAGVLFDTFAKGDGRFFDWVDEQVLARQLDRIHSLGMTCAVAGRLSPEDVSRLSGLPVDIIAVRSAACRNGDRLQGLSEVAISDLHRRIGE